MLDEQFFALNGEREQAAPDVLKSQLLKYREFRATKTPK